MNELAGRLSAQDPTHAEPGKPSWRQTCAGVKHVRIPRCPKQLDPSAELLALTQATPLTNISWATASLILFMPTGPHFCLPSGNLTWQKKIQHFYLFTDDFPIPNPVFLQPLVSPCPWRKGEPYLLRPIREAVHLPVSFSDQNWGIGVPTCNHL